MPRWEYRTRTLSLTFGADWLQERLAEMGEQGWELVVALPLGGGTSVDHHTYVFKRPKADTALSLAPHWGAEEVPATIGPNGSADRAA